MSEHIEVFNALVKEYPNDSDLGKEFRKLYPETLVSLNHPNNSDLGAFLRSLVNSKKSVKND